MIKGCRKQEDSRLNHHREVTILLTNQRTAVCQPWERGNYWMISILNHKNNSKFSWPFWDFVLSFFLLLKMVELIYVSLGSSGGVGVTLDESPCNHRPDIYTQTAFHSPIHTFQETPSFHVFGVLEEAGIPGENPPRHKETMVVYWKFFIFTQSGKNREKQSLRERRFVDS